MNEKKIDLFFLISSTITIKDLNLNRKPSKNKQFPILGIRNTHKDKQILYEPDMSLRKLISDYFPFFLFVSFIFTFVFSFFLLSLMMKFFIRFLMISIYRHNDDGDIYFDSCCSASQFEVICQMFIIKRNSSFLFFPLFFVVLNQPFNLLCVLRKLQKNKNKKREK